jgi:hypothetical protein
MNHDQVNTQDDGYLVKPFTTSDKERVFNDLKLVNDCRTL